MLTGITLENFKAFKAPQYIPIKPITLIFGRNNAGKSSIFHALAFLKFVFETKGYCDPDVVDSGWSKVHLESWQNIVHGHDASAKMKITLHDECGSIQWVFRIDPSVGTTPRVDSFLIFNKDGQPVAKGKNSASHGIRWAVNLHRSHPLWSAFEFKLLQRLLNTPTDQKISEPFKEYFNNWIGDSWRPLPECLQDDSVVSALFPSHLSEEEFRLHVDALHSGEVSSFSENIEKLLAAIRVSNEASINECLDLFQEKIVWGKSDREMERCFLSLLHIGSNRVLPASLVTLRHLSTSSESEAWRILLRTDKDDYFPPRERVNRMLEVLDINYSVETRLREEIAFSPSSGAAEIRLSYGELVLQDKIGGLFHPIHSLGSGVGKILPVVVGLAVSDAELLIIEEPECHVHPRVQARLGDLVIERARPSDYWQRSSATLPDDIDYRDYPVFIDPPINHTIVETHSEHLILRILRRIRETTRGKLPEGVPSVRPEDVAVLFVEPGVSGHPKCTT